MKHEGRSKRSHTALLQMLQLPIQNLRQRSSALHLMQQAIPLVETALADSEVGEVEGAVVFLLSFGWW